MVLESRSAAQWFHIPQSTFEVMAHTQFDDVFATKKDPGVENPMVASYFIIEKTNKPATRSPVYTSEETGVVIKGTLRLTDETGTAVILGEGSTFFIHRHSQITFEAFQRDFVALYKAATRWSIHQGGGHD